MTNLTSQAGQPDIRSGFSPDGLTESAVDALIAEVDAVLAASPVPTSALLDGTAAERRRRRMGRRAVTAVVRALPLTRPVYGSDGEAA